MKVGDNVRVIKLAPKHQNTKNLPWVEDYDSTIGEVGEIVYMNKTIIVVSFLGDVLRTYYSDELQETNDPVTNPWWAANYSNLLI